jgi:replication factor C subunit 3/5
MLEACKVQKYPFTKTQDVPEIDWQRFLDDTANQILLEQSPQKLEKIRDRLYELLSQGIPPNMIFKRLVQVLTKKCDVEVKSQIYEFASLYEFRMQLGSKQIYHLEAFVAHFMMIYKRFLMQTAEMMELDME